MSAMLVWKYTILVIMMMISLSSAGIDSTLSTSGIGEKIDDSRDGLETVPLSAAPTEILAKTDASSKKETSKFIPIEKDTDVEIDSRKEATTPDQSDPKQQSQDEADSTSDSQCDVEMHEECVDSTKPESLALGNPDHTNQMEDTAKTDSDQADESPAHDDLTLIGHEEVIIVMSSEGDNKKLKEIGTIEDGSLEDHNKNGINTKQENGNKKDKDNGYATLSEADGPAQNIPVAMEDKTDDDREDKVNEDDGKCEDVVSNEDDDGDDVGPNEDADCDDEVQNEDDRDDVAQNNKDGRDDVGQNEDGSDCEDVVPNEDHSREEIAPCQKDNDENVSETERHGTSDDKDGDIAEVDGTCPKDTKMTDREDGDEESDGDEKSKNESN